MIPSRSVLLVFLCSGLAACGAPLRDEAAVPSARVDAPAVTAEQAKRASEPDTVPAASVEPSGTALEDARADASLESAAPGEPAPAPALKPASEAATAPVATPASAMPVPAAAAAPTIVATAPSPASAVQTEAATRATLRGKLKLVGNRGVTIAPGEVSEAFVYYLPRSGGEKAVPARFDIETRDKRFLPATLVVPIGSTVRFPNRDVVLHNAFSVSADNNFDLGIYGQDKSREFTFRRAGLVIVHCNVHHSMQADVLVIDSPYSTRVQADGSFALPNVPVGSGALYLWHPRAALQSRLVDVPTDKPYVTELVVTKPRVPPHLNKLGQSYRAARAGATP